MFECIAAHWWATTLKCVAKMTAFNLWVLSDLHDSRLSFNKRRVSSVLLVRLKQGQFSLMATASFPIQHKSRSWLPREMWQKAKDNYRVFKLLWIIIQLSFCGMNQDMFDQQRSPPPTCQTKWSAANVLVPESRHNTTCPELCVHPSWSELSQQHNSKQLWLTDGSFQD